MNFLCDNGDFFVLLLLFFLFVFLLQSKEIAFQLQEDLMKVLNELYTVSSNDCYFSLMHLNTFILAVVETSLQHWAQFLTVCNNLMFLTLKLEDIWWILNIQANVLQTKYRKSHISLHHKSIKLSPLLS